VEGRTLSGREGIAGAQPKAPVVGGEDRRVHAAREIGGIGHPADTSHVEAGCDLTGIALTGRSVTKLHDRLGRVAAVHPQDIADQLGRDIDAQQTSSKLGVTREHLPKALREAAPRLGGLRDHLCVVSDRDLRQLDLDRLKGRRRASR
jgi:hypothetical protein